MKKEIARYKFSLIHTYLLPHKYYLYLNDKFLTVYN